jgi:hypothetical protein
LAWEKWGQDLVRGVVFMTAVAVALAPPSFAQPGPLPTAEAGVTAFNLEQLDAILAPIVLCPDELLTQTLDGVDLSVAGRRRLALARKE